MSVGFTCCSHCAHCSRLFCCCKVALKSSSNCSTRTESHPQTHDAYRRNAWELDEGHIEEREEELSRGHTPKIVRFVEDMTKILIADWLKFRPTVQHPTTRFVNLFRNRFLNMTICWTIGRIFSFRMHTFQCLS